MKRNLQNRAARDDRVLAQRAVERRLLLLHVGGLRPSRHLISPAFAADDPNGWAATNLGSRFGGVGRLGWPRAAVEQSAFIWQVPLYIGALLRKIALRRARDKMAAEMARFLGHTILFLSVVVSLSAMTHPINERWGGIQRSYPFCFTPQSFHFVSHVVPCCFTPHRSFFPTPPAFFFLLDPFFFAVPSPKVTTSPHPVHHGSIRYRRSCALAGRR